MKGICACVHFEGTELVVSDLVFASELKKAESAGRFVKNGWRVVPNTTRFFRAGKPIQIYFEVYNFKLMPNNPNDSFVLGYSLIDTADVVVKSYPAKRLNQARESVVKTETLETEGLSVAHTICRSNYLTAARANTFATNAQSFSFRMKTKIHN